MKKNLILSIVSVLLLLAVACGGVPVASAPPGETWQSSIFGSSTTASSAVNQITVNADQSVTIESTGNGGKISSTVEGIAFYHTPLDSAKPFQLTAKVKVESYTNASQVSFGIMLRDTVGVNGDSSGHASNFVAVGALAGKMQAFYRKGTLLVNPAITLVDAPAQAGNQFILRLIKTADNQCVVSCGSQTAVIDSAGFFSGSQFYLGLFAARNAKVTFSDIELLTTVANVAVSSRPARTEYLTGQALDLSGLGVTATEAGGAVKTLTAKDYVVTGFDNNAAGTQNLTVHYGGKTASFQVNVVALACTAMDIAYEPAKTTYYLNDRFDPAGMVINGTFNTGAVRPLDPAEYTLSGFDSATPGKKTVIAALKADPAKTASFTVTVKPAALLDLEIRKPPEKTRYFLGESLDLDGMVVYAKYSDRTEARLTKDEYAASALDAATPGEKEVALSHKGKTAILKVTVKAKELTGIQVTKYPKTTYWIGQSFDAAGLEVSKVYDNLDREVLPAGEYAIDSSALDSARTGVYPIRIVPKDGRLAPLTLPVTVRENMAYTWKTIRFGQSTSETRNYATVKENGNVELVALEGGGKVTGDHDGITFYYTEIDGQKDNFVLSADIQVKAYAKNPHDGQESFGIMARDAIGKPGDSSIFASNIAAVGGHSGGTGNPNGTQLFIRTGITSPDGAGSKGVQRKMLLNEKPEPGNTHPAKPYRLTLARTNSGFTGRLNNGAAELFFQPDILKVQDSKIYVGFYAARLATIEVSNIQFTVTAAETDAPKVDPPKEKIVPGLEILSPDKTSKTTYPLLVRANVDGIVTVKKGNRVIARDKAVAAGQILTVPAAIAAGATTPFSVAFLPEDTQYLTSYEKIVKNFTVTRRSYAPNGDIYVSPRGSGAGTGTESAPLDLDTAIEFVREGQTIILLDGQYLRSSKLEIKKYNDGTAGAMKYLVAAPGARPVIDFNKKSEGVLLSGDYWHVKGIDFARSAANTKGFTIGGNHNIVELCNFYQHGDTGLQISRTDLTLENLSDWPSHNLILNCTSYDNRDPSDNNADGFAAKLTAGVGNVFRGCISHHNIDDGWDLYTKAGSGAIGTVLIEGCIAYANGALTDGTVGRGDKNGFKLGGEGIAVPHVIRNSLAFGNGAVGFTSNSNPAVQALDCVSYDNGRANLEFTSYPGIPLQFVIRNFVSYRSGAGGSDSYPAFAADQSNYFWNGSASVNQSGTVLNPAIFAGLTPSLPYQRDAEGNIIWGDFLKIKR
ncbi:Ig-like protein group 3 [Hydrogenispora ethanolica]|uniref:Ig-like protein group 3 n=1 Tax=Hydrogenispora ethanolica TaxID=1082276 RepID=A0A4R1RY19_HYDET|nr:bacterial Ig-like domain-containing protein [Hydrogenispora ethanolica]TCL71648.1 Ig-like protein group 3 [Hydrogenispora ethanolica]